MTIHMLRQLRIIYCVRTEQIKSPLSHLKNKTFRGTKPFYRLGKILFSCLFLRKLSLHFRGVPTMLSCRVSTAHYSQRLLLWPSQASVSSCCLIGGPPVVQTRTQRGSRPLMLLPHSWLLLPRSSGQARNFSSSSLRFRHRGTSLQTLKGLSHDIFRPGFWPVWMHLGLRVNCVPVWFVNFYDSPVILDSHF
jgi:hypothetical protein